MTSGKDQDHAFQSLAFFADIERPPIEIKPNQQREVIYV
jgi:hypothetical protein